MNVDFVWRVLSARWLLEDVTLRYDFDNLITGMTITRGLNQNLNL